MPGNRRHNDTKSVWTTIPPHVDLWNPVSTRGTSLSSKTRTCQRRRGNTNSVDGWTAPLSRSVYLAQYYKDNKDNKEAITAYLA